MWTCFCMNLLFLEAVWLFAPSSHFGKEQGKAIQVFILYHGLILVFRCSCQTGLIAPDPHSWKQTCMYPVMPTRIQSTGTIWLLECDPAPFKKAMTKCLCASWNSYVGRYQMGTMGDLGSAGQTAGSGHFCSS